MVHPLGWWGGGPLCYHPTVLLWEGWAADEERETENDEGECACSDYPARSSCGHDAYAADDDEYGAGDACE